MRSYLILTVVAQDKKFGTHMTLTLSNYLLQYVGTFPFPPVRVQFRIFFLPLPITVRVYIACRFLDLISTFVDEALRCTFTFYSESISFFSLPFKKRINLKNVGFLCFFIFYFLLPLSPHLSNSHSFFPKCASYSLLTLRYYKRSIFFFSPATLTLIFFLFFFPSLSSWNVSLILKKLLPKMSHVEYKINTTKFSQQFCMFKGTFNNNWNVLGIRVKSTNKYHGSQFRSLRHGRFYSSHSENIYIQTFTQARPQLQTICR